jgi:fructuronate reductase
LGDVERSPELVPAFRDQGGRFTVLEVGLNDAGEVNQTAKLVDSVVDVAYPGEETPRLLLAMAAPSTRLITLTITEKGYTRGPDGHLDLSQAGSDVAAFRAELEAPWLVAQHACSCSDAANENDKSTWCEACQTGAIPAHAGTEPLGAQSSADAQGSEVAPAKTAIGLLVRGLLARYQGGGAPVTVLSCDNMAHNGKVLKTVVDEFIAAADDAVNPSVGEQSGSDSKELGDVGVSGGVSGGVSSSPEMTGFKKWLAANVTWPSSMVDRITPRVTPETLDQIEQAVGHRDEAGISAEPFTQWVIEDNFAAERPKWELAGAEFVPDVAPWEETKLRMLNGTHSLLAYAGRILGYPTMAEAMAAPEIAPHARAYMFADALPSITVPEGADLPAYGEELLHRFANPATGHTTAQVSTDGSQKIPFRWGAAATYALENGRVPDGIAYGLAAWSEFVRRAVRDGLDLGDPASDSTLISIVHDAGVDSPDTVALALLTLPGLLPDGVGTNPALVAAVLKYVEELAATSESLI